MYVEGKLPQTGCEQLAAAVWLYTRAVDKFVIAPIEVYEKEKHLL